MRIAKLIGALFVVLAFSAIAAGTASAAETLWKWLPGSVGETFKGSGGKALLQIKGGASFACTKSTLLLADPELKVSSELLALGATNGKDATLALAIAHFEGCTTTGLPVNSLGDKSGIILVHYDIHNCMIKKGEFGFLFTPLLSTLEVPAAKLRFEVRGSFIALLDGGKEGTKALTYKLGITQTAGVQTIGKCEGGIKDTLETSSNGGLFIQSGHEVKEPTIEFDMTKDTAGEEPMEK